jgi:hypothetical protein
MDLFALQIVDLTIIYELKLTFGLWGQSGRRASRSRGVCSAESLLHRLRREGRLILSAEARIPPLEGRSLLSSVNDASQVNK